jgi:predicted ester cyclase
MRTGSAGRSVDRVALVRRLFEEPEAASEEMFSKDYVSHAPWDLATERSAWDKPKQRQREGARMLLNHREVFTDVEVTPEDIAEDGDNVILRWRLRGTWTEPLPYAEIKPNGEPVDFTGVRIYRFDGSQAVEGWGEIDTVTVAEQMLGGRGIACGSAECRSALDGIFPPDMVSRAQRMLEGLNTYCGTAECVQLLPVAMSLLREAR